MFLFNNISFMLMHIETVFNHSIISLVYVEYLHGGGG